jgi:hypothetical protein
VKGFLWALLPLGTLVVLLLLNLKESDQYEFGTEQFPAPGNNVDADDGAFARIFPDLKYVHACPGCGECVHRLEVIENRRVLLLHDHDGWYKVFWAKDEEYYYTDPVHLLADWGANRTAQQPNGAWSIRIRSGPATHPGGSPHDCGSLPKDITLTYKLEFSDAPLADTTWSGDGPIKVLQTFSWLFTNPGKPVSLGWRLSGIPKIDVGPCPCAKP